MTTHNTTQKSYFAAIRMSLVLFGILLFFAGTAQTTDYKDDFKKCDANKDKKISKAEFSERFSEDVKKDKELMPGSSDGLYDDETFYESSYKNVDADRDEKLSKDEWEAAADVAYGHYVSEDFDGYDYNNDGYLSYEEYQKSMKNTDYFNDWDTNRDDKVDSNEYSEKLFDSYDQNEDDYLDETEYGEYYSDHSN